MSEYLKMKFLLVYELDVLIKDLTKEVEESTPGIIANVRHA
jgi:hypothetical protein